MHQSLNSEYLNSQVNFLMTLLSVIFWTFKDGINLWNNSVKFFGINPLSNINTAGCENIDVEVKKPNLIKLRLEIFLIRHFGFFFLLTRKGVIDSIRFEASQAFFDVIYQYWTGI